MGESYELEEGELNCSAIDDLYDFSYIEKKLQNLLGHFQRPLNMFGPKVYDYGSFLPTYKRSPAVLPCQRSSMGNNAVQKVPNNLPVKNVVQKFQSLPAASCKPASIQESQTNQTSGSLLPQAPGKVTVKKEDAKIPGNGLSDHKPIRVRIKMGSKILSQKITMVCNDLGLDDSPNSPTLNSSSRMVPHTPQEKTSESPSRILQEMTSMPVSEDLLMSPLPNSLLILKNKEKPCTLLGNEPVTKARKVPLIQTQEKFSGVLSCGESPSGRKRKGVNCFNTSLTGEVKKQKVSSTGPLVRESSTSGVGGINSTSDGFTTKSNLQKGIKKDVEGDRRVAFAKPNKMKVVGKHAEKERKTYPIKLKQNSSKSDKVLSKDTGNIIQDSMGIALAPSSTSLEKDSWAQCDSCLTWRLLPFVAEPDDLPDKWVCSMQTWLPRMNHCKVSEEETTNAVISLLATGAHGAGTINAEKNYQSLTAGCLPNVIEKKPILKDSSQRVTSNILVDAAKPTRSTSHVLKIKNIKLPLKTHNAAPLSTDFGVSQKFTQDKIDQKAKGRSGTGVQIKIKKEKEGDNQESERSKQIKTGYGNKLSRDVKAEEIHCKQDLDCAPAERKTKRHDDDIYTSDVERATKKRLIAPKKKPDHQTQPKTGSGSLRIKAHGIINSPVRIRNQPEQEVRKQGTNFGDLPCTSMKTVPENRAGIKNVNVITHETMDRSPQAANDILQEAEKKKKLADCLKVAKYDDKANKANFNAALKFLLGASLLEMSSTEKVEEGRMSHVEAYHTAAKLSESCAHRYETNKEMYAAALAYKCMEVACMRVVYCKSPGLSGEWNELQKMVQMTPQGESPSSSASDVDSFYHQGVIDKSAKTKRGLSHVVGSILPVPRNHQNFVPLLEFTEIMNLAMEASAKSQQAFGAATSEETQQHKDCVSAIKKVVDFSFHDVEALIQMIKVAKRALSSSKVRGPKC
ncbi:unnamed protein product [Eruca vesicaria subsp. sativa]|uniref:CW-type domain-containing protein n=1 Tax=Eruca vesicaria subsp. sativa TaxID=29727 RepID=A0ABC8J9L8_ERUVS|nr:unnamed protein product [Eruca vesicaria subsp. sativa]